jgi:sortase A
VSVAASRADPPPDEADAPALATAAVAEPAGRRSSSGLLMIVLASILSFSLVTLFFGAFAFGLSGLQEQRSQQQLYDRFRGLLAPNSLVAPSIGGVIPAGTPVALLNSPQGGLDNVVVVEGTSSGDLLAGPGHTPDSPLPGQVGDSVLIGKSATAGGPFRGILKLRPGDAVSVQTGQGTFHFVVLDNILAGQRMPLLPPSDSLLTLVTSAGSGWLGRLAPNHLVYVNAALVGRPVAAPPGRPTTAPPADTQGHGDPAAWPWVVAWALALLAAAVAATWTWSRLGVWRMWILAVPVIVGILWGLSNEVLRLLPNVY